MTMPRRARLMVACLGILVAGMVTWWVVPGDRAPARSPAVPAASEPPGRSRAPVRPPKPVRTSAEPREADRDVIDGRVLHAVTRDGVPDAELTFLGDGGVSTFRTGSDGTFLLTPPATGSLALSTITAPGFLPYVPEPGRGGAGIVLARGQPVHGVTLLLSPAIDHDGIVFDGRGAGVEGAQVRLVRSATDDAVLDSLASAWSTGAGGRFTFQAAEEAVLEARRGGARGWARVDGDIMHGGTLRIVLGAAPPRDATITGRVRDASGAPIAGAQVRAVPSLHYGDAGAVYATTGADGAFALPNVDRAAYDLTAEAAAHIPATRINILGGSRSVELTLDAGLMLAGDVVDHRGAPIPVFTLLVRRRAGAARPVVATRSIVDPRGRFAVRVTAGDYELFASARGCACGTPTQATAGARDVRVVLGGGATLRGRVIAGDDHAPIDNATIRCESAVRARDLPADAGAVTRADGSFELTGIPAGPLTIGIRADGYHGKVAATMAASDGAVLGPITIELARVTSGEPSRVELVGIGVMLSPDGDALRVEHVQPDSNAFEVGIGFGDHVVAIDGRSVVELGIDGALAQLSGTIGTTVTLTLRRDGRHVDVVVERRAIWRRGMWLRGQGAG